MNKLNIGCGKDIKKGYINLDKSKVDGVDVVHDLDTYPWPFEDDFFDEVYGRDIIEHSKDLFKSMMEIKMSKQTTDEASSMTKMSSERAIETHTQSDRTGNYGAEDLQNILGDPRQGVSVPITGTLPKSAVTTHKK